jgi:hypothetical protein
MIGIMMRRISSLVLLAFAAFISLYLAAYYRFLDRQCLEVTECID